MLVRECDHFFDRVDRHCGEVLVDLLYRRPQFEIGNDRVRFNARALDNGSSTHSSGYLLNVRAIRPVHDLPQPSECHTPPVVYNAAPSCRLSRPMRCSERRMVRSLRMELAIRIQVEELPEVLFLATSDELQDWSHKVLPLLRRLRLRGTLPGNSSKPGGNATAFRGRRPQASAVYDRSAIWISPSNEQSIVKSCLGQAASGRTPFWIRAHDGVCRFGPG